MYSIMVSLAVTENEAGYPKSQSLTGAIPPEGGIGGAARNQVGVPLSRPERLVCTVNMFAAG